MRALGVEWLRGGADGITLLLPWAPRASIGGVDRGDGDGDARIDGIDGIDHRAAVALLDYAGGIAVYAGLPSVAAATLELRIDITGPAPAGDVEVDARFVAVYRGSACVLGEARHRAEGSAPFLRMSARYIVGSGPGQAPAGPGYVAARDARQAAFAGIGLSDARRFDDLLGAVPEEGGWRLPFAPALVGSVTLPAFHGGAVAAALMTALEAAGRDAVPVLGLSTITVEYLRPARATDIRLATTVTHAGKRAAFMEAGAWQGDTLVAKAQALFG